MSQPEEDSTQIHEHSERHPRRFWIYASAALAGCAALALVLGSLLGFRMFIMETPSMGTAAPVGSLVVTQPTSTSSLHVGDIVTFGQTGASQTHTHRVVSIGDGGVRTQGDINGAPDAESVTEENLVGRAVFIAPVLGWIIKMLPIVTIVWVLSLLLTRRMGNPFEKYRYRVFGFFLGLAISLAIVRPLLGSHLLWLRVDKTGDAPQATARVVNTGLFPIRVSPLDGHGSPSDLLDRTGVVGNAVGTRLDEHGKFTFYPHLELSFFWWFGLILFCLVPLVWTAIHHRRHRDEEAQFRSDREAARA